MKLHPVRRLSLFLAKWMSQLLVAVLILVLALMLPRAASFSGLLAPDANYPVAEWGVFFATLATAAVLYLAAAYLLNHAVWFPFTLFDLPSAVTGTAYLETGTLHGPSEWNLRLLYLGIYTLALAALSYVLLGKRMKRG